jgi:hypothetical protein
MRKEVREEIEPINRFESTFIHTAEEDLSFGQLLDCKGLVRVCDTFHASLPENSFHRRCPKESYDGSATLEATLPVRASVMPQAGRPFRWFKTKTEAIVSPGDTPRKGI